MTKRSYDQFCPIAYALDKVSNRWTLLIVRELRYGPRRFKDLLEGLSGIGNNLLAQRLKELDQDGIVQRRILPPPAGTTVYELSQLGQGLEDVLIALSNWGVNFVQIPPPEKDFLSVISAMGAVERFFSAPDSQGIKTLCEVHTRSEVFYIRVDDGNLEVVTGLSNTPDIVVQTDLNYFMGLMSGQISFEEISSKNSLKIEKGNVSSLKHFLSLFKM